MQMKHEPLLLLLINTLCFLSKGMGMHNSQNVKHGILEHSKMFFPPIGGYHIH
jgi:hypothetical protein